MAVATTPAGSLSRSPNMVHVLATAVLLWISVLFTFALSHIASACSLASPVFPFLCAALSILAGGIASFYIAASIGNAANARLLFVFNIVVAAAAGVVHVDDSGLLQVLVCLAGFTNGGMHSILSYLMSISSKTTQRYLICVFPLLLFPVALVEQMLSLVSVRAALTLGALITIAAGVGLFTLPESIDNNRSQEASASTPRDSDNGATTVNGIELPRALRRAQSNPEWNSPIETAASDNADNTDIQTLHNTDGNASEADEHANEMDDLLPAQSSTNRGKSTLLHSVVGLLPWTLSCLLFYLCTLTFLTPLGEPMLEDHSACQWRFAPTKPRNLVDEWVWRGGETSSNNGSSNNNGDSNGNDNGAGLPVHCINPRTATTFTTGAHVIAADVLAWAATCMVLLWLPRLLHRFRQVCLCAAAAASAIAAVLFTLSWCDASSDRAALEFAIRMPMMATLHIQHFIAKQTHRSVAPVIFRGAALVTLLAMLPGSFTTARLQWTTYSLQNRYSIYGWFEGSSMSKVAGSCILGMCALWYSVHFILKLKRCTSDVFELENTSGSVSWWSRTQQHPYLRVQTTDSPEDDATDAHEGVSIVSILEPTDSEEFEHIRELLAAAEKCSTVAEAVIVLPRLRQADSELNGLLGAEVRKLSVALQYHTTRLSYVISASKK